jgi:hypothetical protein
MRATDRGGGTHQFCITRGRRVIDCVDEQSRTGQAACAAFGQIDWYPFHAFARRNGRSLSDAQDLTTRGLFWHLLENRTLRYFAAIGEEGDGTITNPAEIHGKIRALWDVLFAAKGG